MQEVMGKFQFMLLLCKFVMYILDEQLHDALFYALNKL